MFDFDLGIYVAVSGWGYRLLRHKSQTLVSDQSYADLKSLILDESSNSL